jgi:hypothetical protein
MADVDNIIGMVSVLKLQARMEVIREVEAFAGDYHHHIDGRDVVIVEQLLDFLKSKETNNDK